MYKGKQVLSLVTLIVVMAVLLSCGPGQPAAPTAAPAAEQPTSAPAPTAEQPAAAAAKVALLINSSCSDTGWGSATCNGLEKAKTDFKVDGTISEKMQQADIEPAMRDYADRGYGLIIGSGFNYGDPAKAVAADFPNTQFAVIASDVVNGKNLTSFAPRYEQMGYLAGVVAGYMSKTKKIGAIGGMEIPTIVPDMEGFCQGAQSVDPSITCQYAYLGTFEDIQKGKEAALAMIANGADVLYHDASFGGVGMIQAAKEKGVMAIGFGTDQRDQAPGTVLTSGLVGNEQLVELVVDRFLKGELKGALERPGVAEGAFLMGPYDEKVPQSVQDAVAQAAKDIASGKIVVKEVLTPSQ